jgi:hypothetical protein
MSEKSGSLGSAGVEFPRMRIVFHKTSGERHGLEIVHDCGERERVECETRSCLVHDFLHFATEAAAHLDGGFWGNLAKGKTLADMNDRTGQRMAEEGPAMMSIERVVGALSLAAKGRSPRDVVSAIGNYMSNLDVPMPHWLTEEFVAEVQEQLRQLLGRWNATPYGGTMSLDWNEHGATHASDAPAAVPHDAVVAVAAALSRHSITLAGA